MNVLLGDITSTKVKLEKIFCNEKPNLNEPCSNDKPDCEVPDVFFTLIAGNKRIFFHYQGSFTIPERIVTLGKPSHDKFFAVPFTVVVAGP